MKQWFEAAALAKDLAARGNGEYQTKLSIELTEHGFRVYGRLYTSRELGMDYEGSMVVLMDEDEADRAALHRAVRTVADMLGIPA